MSLKLMYITNDLEVARIADKYGIDRVFIDLETLGKEERQKNLNSVKSHHTLEDIKKIAPHMQNAKTLVRVNPWNKSSKKEIEATIKAGADIIMLPMYKTVKEVKRFVKTVKGRAKTLLLLETKEAENCLDKTLKVKGVDEIHIGLNDLHLSYGLDFMFQLLANGVVENITKKIKEAGKPFGIGGIAGLGQGLLPAENVIIEHYRLGSSMAILSRSFCNYEKIKDLKEIEKVFAENIKSLKEFEKEVSKYSQEDFEKNKQEVVKIVKEITDDIKKRKENGI